MLEENLNIIMAVGLILLLPQDTDASAKMTSFLHAVVLEWLVVTGVKRVVVDARKKNAAPGIAKGICRE